MAPEVILSGDVDHQEYDARADVWFVTQIVLTTVMRMMMIHDAPKFCSFLGPRGPLVLPLVDPLVCKKYLDHLHTSRCMVI